MRCLCAPAGSEPIACCTPEPIMALIIAQGIRELCSLSLCALILLIIKEAVQRRDAACLGRGPHGLAEPPTAVPLEGSVALIATGWVRGSA